MNKRDRVLRMYYRADLKPMRIAKITGIPWHEVLMILRAAGAPV